MSRTLCIDLGGSRVKLAVVEDGCVADSETFAVGDAKALRLFGIVSRALGAGTLALAHAFDSEVVIWSGGVSHFTALIEEAQRYVLENAWTPWGKIAFRTAADPEASVTLGLHSLWEV